MLNYQNCDVNSLGRESLSEDPYSGEAVSARAGVASDIRPVRRDEGESGQHRIAPPIELPTSNPPSRRRYQELERLGHSPAKLVADAKEVVLSQARAVSALADRINGNFTEAVELMLSCRGHVVVSGMGKSGLIAQKIAATLASTGTPAFFIHPADALHGDLGMVTPGDVAMLISYSGETDEVTRLAPHLRQLDVPIVGLMGHESSSLGRVSSVTLDVSVEREACPHNLAPTNSTLATLAMGDALAVALMRARDFKPRDFARFHPGGSLGRRLLTRVRDAMHREPLPVVGPECGLGEALLVMTQGQRGLLIVRDDVGQLLGIVTDGDLRRGMQKYPDLLQRPVKCIMSRRPVTIQDDAMLAEAEERMLRLKLSALVVLDASGKICGIVEIFNNR